MNINLPGNVLTLLPAKPNDLPTDGSTFTLYSPWYAAATCPSRIEGQDRIVTGSCRAENAWNRWTYDPATKQLTLGGMLCAETAGSQVNVAHCDSSKAEQQWASQGSPGRELYEVLIFQESGAAARYWTASKDGKSISLEAPGAGESAKDWQRFLPQRSAPVPSEALPGGWTTFQIVTDSGECTSRDTAVGGLRREACDDLNANQQWIYDDQLKRLESPVGDYCAERTTGSTPGLAIKACTSGADQQWVAAPAATGPLDAIAIINADAAQHQYWSANGSALAVADSNTAAGTSFTIKPVPGLPSDGKTVCDPPSGDREQETEDANYMAAGHACVRLNGIAGDSTNYRLEMSAVATPWRFAIGWWPERNYIGQLSCSVSKKGVNGAADSLVASGGIVNVQMSGTVTACQEVTATIPIREVANYYVEWNFVNAASPSGPGSGVNGKFSLG
ncbi:RICIN domain-containing protein [Glycomyces dulcitolivorans]|uniref:RICIN domain-containing protein n=1 Tax=Glycomyces dulcitolivorans TaxID=2200759 RepID=UPI0013009077|nr:RICIN domain-containing protein [Glycomyces dulcitolivorans]